MIKRVAKERLYSKERKRIGNHKRADRMAEKHEEIESL
jgi:hypothetical protein